MYAAVMTLKALLAQAIALCELPRVASVKQGVALGCEATEGCSPLSIIGGGTSNSPASTRSDFTHSNYWFRARTLGAVDMS